MPPKFQNVDRLLGPFPPATADDQEQVVEAWPEMFRKMFMITINSSRLLAAQGRIGGLSKYVTVANGINGKNLDLKALQKEKVYKPINRYNPMTRGEIGCFLSHRAVWKQMIDEKVPYAVILEDDVLLHPHPAILHHITRGLQELQYQDWNILFLSRNPRMPTKKNFVTPHVIRLQRSWGLFCYAISLRAAEYLYAHSNVIREACDIFVSVAALPHKYALHPPICFVSDAKSDTIHIK